MYIHMILTRSKLERLRHHVDEESVVVRGFRDAHGVGHPPPHEGVPRDSLVPACSVLQEVLNLHLQQPLVPLLCRRVLVQYPYNSQ